MLELYCFEAVQRQNVRYACKLLCAELYTVEAHGLQMNLTGIYRIRNFNSLSILPKYTSNTAMWFYAQINVIIQEKR